MAALLISGLPTIEACAGNLEAMRIKFLRMGGSTREITGALRIYTVAMGESFPHFHGHMVPRYAETPGDVKTYGVFLLSRSA